MARSRYGDDVSVFLNGVTPDLTEEQFLALSPVEQAIWFRRCFPNEQAMTECFGRNTVRQWRRMRTGNTKNPSLKNQLRFWNLIQGNYNPDREQRIELYRLRAQRLERGGSGSTIFQHVEPRKKYRGSRRTRQEVA